MYIPRSILAIETIKWHKYVKKKVGKRFMNRSIFQEKKILHIVRIKEQLISPEERATKMKKTMIIFVSLKNT